jgi:hypothetical protein
MNNYAYRRFPVLTAIILGSAIAASPLAAEPSAATTLTEAKAALELWQPFIGQWRGVGQPQRGSSRGAWSETSDWAWRFAGPSAAALRRRSHHRRASIGPVRIARQAA